jgi:hypothetical protein
MHLRDMQWDMDWNSFVKNATETSNYTKGGDFIDNRLSHYQVLWKGYYLWSMSGYYLVNFPNTDIQYIHENSIVPVVYV